MTLLRSQILAEDISFHMRYSHQGILNIFFYCFLDFNFHSSSTNSISYESWHLQLKFETSVRSLKLIVWPQEVWEVTEVKMKKILGEISKIGLVKPSVRKLTKFTSVQCSGLTSLMMLIQDFFWRYKKRCVRYGSLKNLLYRYVQCTLCMLLKGYPLFSQYAYMSVPKNTAN